MEYRSPLPATWQVLVALLQESGDPIVHADKDTGIITTEWKAEGEEWRHQFVLRVTSNAESSTTVAVACSVESLRSGRKWKDEQSDGKREALLLRAVAQRLDPSSPGPSVPSPFCVANFTVGGSMLRGTSYSSFDEFSGLPPEAAAKALQDSAARETFTIASAGNVSGAYIATGMLGGRGQESATFNLIPITGGTKIEVVYKLPAGRHGVDDAIRDQLCSLLGGVARLTRRPLASTLATQPAGDQLTIESRLRKLEELHNKGLITDEEYKKKRAELLSKL